jgi:hypothetical protein
MQPVHDPDRGHAEAEMRIVGQDRLAALGPIAGNDPVVRADTVAADAVAAVEARELRDRGAEARQVGQGGVLVARDGRGSRAA